jgi:hypothetical protein
MNLNPRVRRLERANAIDADDWLSSLSDDELLFWIHHKSRAVLAAPAITAENRAKVASKIAALSPPLSIDEHRARALIALPP